MARVLLHTFESEPMTGGQPPAITIRNGRGEVVISGGLSVTGSACAIDSVVTQRYRSLVLRVTSTPVYQGPPRVLDYRYQVRLLDLKPGRYQLQVRHAVLVPRRDGTSEMASLTVFEGEVRSEGDDSGNEDDRGGRAVVYRHRARTGAGQP